MGPLRVSAPSMECAATLGGQTWPKLFKRVTNAFHSVINHFMFRQNGERGVREKGGELAAGVELAWFWTNLDHSGSDLY